MFFTSRDCGTGDWVWRHRGAGVTGNPPAWPTPLVWVSSLCACVGEVILLHSEMRRYVTEGER